MTHEESYKQKKVSIEEALSHIHSGETLIGGLYANEPVQIYMNLHTLYDRVDSLAVWINNCTRAYPFALESKYWDKIHIRSIFLGKTSRRTYYGGGLSFYPFDLSRTAADMTAHERPYTYVGAVSTMDEDGYLYLSPSIQIEREAFDNAEKRIVEVNPRIPHICGKTKVHISEIDCLIEDDSELEYIPEIETGDTERRIAAYVDEFIRDGDTIQVGIGKTPNALMEKLLNKNDLGIHSEMCSSHLANLIRCGVANGSRKTFHKGVAICGFIFADQATLDYLDYNPALELHETSYVNNPINIAKNDNMVSVNAACELDLMGQIASETIGAREYSGPGGAADFALGAALSKGGRGIIAISSTTMNGRKSRILPYLEPGSVVTITRNISDYVITEYGVAHLRGESLESRAEQLINIAHPDFRDGLRDEAKKMGLLKR